MTVFIQNNGDEQAVRFRKVQCDAKGDETQVGAQHRFPIFLPKNTLEPCSSRTIIHSRNISQYIGCSL